MGKEEVVVPGEPPAAADTSRCCGLRTACKWPISVILGLYVLAFALWSIRFRGDSSGNSQHSSPAPWTPHVKASFRLHRAILDIQGSLPQLQLDLQNEIGIPNTQIDIVSIVPLRYKNWTEVSFIVSPDSSSDLIAAAELSLLRETFVELFMQRSVNLSLTSTVFGEVSHFEVLHFPGGITVVPSQPGFPLKRLVLFNFTLHNSLTHVHRNFAKFRLQLANGIILKPTENLFVQLTNLQGSTVNSPLVVQTSILPVVGVMLPSTRLKQLAQEITASPTRNLGLNHTLFGRVKKIELSSFLEYTLEAPAPSPGPSPAPALPPSISPSSEKGSRHGHSRRHHHHSHSSAPAAEPPYYHKGRPTSIILAPAPQQQVQCHLEGGLAPSCSPSVWSPSPSPSPSPSHLIAPSNFPSSHSVPPSPSSLPMGPSGPIQSPSVESPLPADVSSGVPGPSKAPLEVPHGSSPKLSPSAYHLNKRIGLVPVGSPPLTSSGVIVRAPMWILICVTVVALVWQRIL